MSRSSKGQGHVCEYEVNRLTNEKFLEENKTLRQMTPTTRPPPH